MKTKLLLLMTVFGASLFAGGLHVRVGVGIGPGYGYVGPAYGYYEQPVYYAPPVAPVAVYARPAYPGRGHVWINGYYYPVGQRYHWRQGYWARPPFAGARWYGPRYHGGRYYGGHWRR